LKFVAIQKWEKQEKMKFKCCSRKISNAAALANGHVLNEGRRAGHHEVQDH
jgi:hypothetical protein